MKAAAWGTRPPTPAGRRRPLPPDTLPNLARRRSGRAGRFRAEHQHAEAHLFLLARELEMGLPFLTSHAARVWLRRVETWRPEAAFDLLQLGRLAALCVRYEPERRSPGAAPKRS